MIALLALVMAMGGTSIARSVVNGHDLKNGSVTKAKIAKGAINSSKLAKGAVTAKALAAGSVTGPALGAGAVAAGNLAPGAVSWRSLGGQVVAATPVTLPGATSVAYYPATATVSCPSGMVAISGGESFTDTSNAFVIQSAQVGVPGTAPTGWSATGAAGGSAAQMMTVYAICIAGGL